MTVGPMPAERLVDLGRDAAAAFARVGQRLVPADDERQTPCREFTVADLLAHLERSMVLLAGCAGATLDAAGADAGADARARRVSALADATLAAWTARGFDGSVPLGSRTLAAADVHAIVLLELAVHAHDLAAAIDPPAGPADEQPSPALVGYLLDRGPVLITPDRRGRSFAPEIEVDGSATPFERLLAFTGRDQSAVAR